MPDMPQAGAPPQDPAAAEQPPAEGGGGGAGFADTITKVDGALYKMTQFVSANEKLGDDVKGAFQTALDSFRSATQVLMAAMGGEGAVAPEEEAPPEGGGAVTTQQGGAGGAVPMSHQAMRGR